jgi:hypothetical protein
MFLIFAYIVIGALAVVGLLAINFVVFGIVMDQAQRSRPCPPDSGRRYPASPPD